MSIFTPFASSYSNHIGGGMTHPVTGAVYFLVTFRANSAGPYRLQVWEDAIPYGDPKLKREWVTGTEDAGPGPWGYGSCTWTPDGSLYVSAPGGVDGSKVKPSTHIEDNLFPPIPLGAGGNDPRVDALVDQLGALGQQVAQLQAGGGMQLLPAPRTSPSWEGRTITGGVEVDVPLTFGVPVARLYHIRFVASAAKADIRIRAGTKDAPHFVTMNTQVANLQDHKNGDAPGPIMWVSVVDNTGTAATARVHLQICGFAT